MDMTVETKSQSAPKRSFDVAFLTGTVEKKEAAAKKVDVVDVVDVSLSDGGGGGSKSAFKKVGKTPPAGSTSSGGGGSGGGGGGGGSSATLSDVAMGYPMSLPAIATTLSLQLLQQNSAKGLAMSLFNPSMFPPGGAASKSYGAGLSLAPGRVDSAAIIEDYLRAQAAIYQQQVSFIFFNYCRCGSVATWCRFYSTIRLYFFQCFVNLGGIN